MASLFALLAAVTYGAADFLGGIATRRATMMGAVLVTQGAGLVFLLLATPLLPDAHVGRAPTWCSARWPVSPAASAWACSTSRWRSGR